MDLASILKGFFFNSFFMNFLMVTIFFGVGGYFGYKWYIKKQLFKYNFIVIKSDKVWEFSQAKIVKTDKGIRKFQLKGLEDPSYNLNINKEPQVYIKGRGYRVVAWDGHGQIAYTNNFTLDKELYLKNSLSQTDRREAVEGQMESIRRANKMTSIQKWSIGVSVMMIVFSSITMIMTAKYYFESADVQEKATDNLLSSMELANEMNKWQKENSISMNRLANIYAQLYDVNITYEIPTS